MAVSNYRELKVWQLGMDLVKRIYTLTSGFPKSEVWGLTSQLQRAAVSIPANIAEGHARSSTKEFIRFVMIAKGSLAELETLLILAGDLGYSKADKLSHILDLCDQESRMLSGLRSSLRAKLKSKR